MTQDEYALVEAFEDVIRVLMPLALAHMATDELHRLLSALERLRENLDRTAAVPAQ